MKILRIKMQAFLNSICTSNERLSNAPKSKNKNLPTLINKILNAQRS